MSLEDACLKFEAWVRAYKDHRSHSSIGDNCPIELMNRAGPYVPPGTCPARNPGPTWFKVGGKVTVCEVMVGAGVVAGQIKAVGPERLATLEARPDRAFNLRLGPEAKTCQERPLVSLLFRGLCYTRKTSGVVTE